MDGRGRDKYDRILARVLVDGTDLNEAIVRNGYGWHYEIGRSDPRLEAAERAARASRAGLWADPKPVPPWQWRRAHADDARAPGARRRP